MSTKDAAESQNCMGQGNELTRLTDEGTVALAQVRNGGMGGAHRENKTLSAAPGVHPTPMKHQTLPKTGARPGGWVQPPQTLYVSATWRRITG